MYINEVEKYYDEMFEEWRRLEIHRFVTIYAEVYTQSCKGS